MAPRPAARSWRSIKAVDPASELALDGAYAEEAATSEEDETLFSNSIGALAGEGRARKAGLGLLALLAVGAVVAHVTTPAKTGAPLGLARSAGLGAGKGVVEKEGLLALATSAASAAESAARLVGDSKKSYKDLNDIYSQLSAPEQEAAKLIAEEGSRKNQTTIFANLQGEQLFPKNNKNDSNQCPDSEEMFGGVCYAKCADLTKGQYPIRTSAFSCCMNQPCSFFNSKFSSPLKLCTGLDVAGRKPWTYCPHQPGDCLRNEEFNLGMCYKKCALLTYDAYPYRKGADTCCKYYNHLACLDPLNTKSSPDFNVGGGTDDFLIDFARIPHMPMPELAEVQTTTTLPTVPPMPALPVAQVATPPVALPPSAVATVDLPPSPGGATVPAVAAGR